MVEDLQYQVLSLNGRVLISNGKFQSNHTILDLNILQNGVYILKISDGIDCLSRRIVKMN